MKDVDAQFCLWNGCKGKKVSKRRVQFTNGDERVTSTMKKEREISCRVIISVIAGKRKGKRGESINGLSSFHSIYLLPDR